MRLPSCILLFAALPSLAQSTFEVVFDDPADEFGMGVEQTADGGYIISGGSDGDMKLLRTDALGNELWSHTYGTMNVDFGYAVKQTSDGGFVLCGMYNGFGQDTLTLVRTDAGGTTLWIKHYPGTLGRDIGYAVQQTTDGGFVVCGSSGSSLADAYLVRTDASGTQLWNSTVDLGAGEMAMALKQTADNGTIVLVQNSGVGDENGELFLLRFDAMGDTLWSRTIATPGPDEARGLDITADGGFVIAGGHGYPARDMLIVRTDDQGVELWRQTYGEAALDDLASDVHVLADGSLAMAGRQQDPQTSDMAMYLGKLDATGGLQWERRFPRGLLSEAWAMDLTSDGGFVLVGNTVDTVGTNAVFDIYLVKTDGAGYSALPENDDPAQQLLLYPNPAADRSYLPINDAGRSTLSCWDAAGRVALTHTFNGAQRAELHLHALAPGAYSVVLTRPDGRTRTGRFVVQR